jgi:nucleoside transporter
MTRYKLPDPRLSLMMFLEFFIWGAWYVTIGNYMAEVGMTDSIYWAYTVPPIGAIVSPFFLGLVADRYFPTEQVLGVMHLAGAAFIAVVPFFEGQALPFILLLLLHNLCYAPTLGLTNTLAFHHLDDQEQEFPLVRVFGTIGWIISGVVVSYVLGADTTPIPLYVAAAAGLALGVYSFYLPHTPPPAKGETVKVREVLGLDALKQLSSPSFNVFLVCSMLISIPLAAYYAYAPVFVNAADIADPVFKMSFGQMSEAAFMLLMPLLFARLGVKWMLGIGMAAWVLRYGLFAGAASGGGVLWMVMFGILLHGVCYDFFFVSGQIYVDKKSTPATRGQGQGLIILATYGIGMLVGAQVSGWVFNGVVSGNVEQALGQWQTFWIIPAVFAALILGAFVWLFDDRVEEDEEAEEIHERGDGTTLGEAETAEAGAETSADHGL